MNYLKFIWDASKAKSNLIKHEVSFEEAKSVFYDENAIEYYDQNNSMKEDRYLLLGLCSKAKILLIYHCYFKEDSIIRIISARKATKTESLYYWRDK
jgi:uncharacterized DUF497 family protein